MSVLFLFIRMIDLRRNDTSDDPCPAMRLVSDSEPDSQSEEDTDNAGRHVHKRSLFGVVPQVPD
jgi:hypothetical protein